jgi:hypothetical protein
MKEFSVPRMQLQVLQDVASAVHKQYASVSQRLQTLVCYTSVSPECVVGLGMQDNESCARSVLMDCAFDLLNDDQQVCVGVCHATENCILC